MRYLPGLRKRQVNTQVFTGTPTADRAKDFDSEITWQSYKTGTITPQEMIEGTAVYRVRLPDGMTRRRGMLYSKKLAHFCQRGDARPDIIQFLPLPLWSAPWLLKLRRHHIPLVSAYNLLEQKTIGATARIVRKLHFQLVDCITVNSKAMRDNLHEFGVTTRIEVIPNGVDLCRYGAIVAPENRQKIRQTLGINNDAPLIVTVGAVEPRKGTDLLLEAWGYLARACEHAHLVIVGPRPDLTNPDYAAFRRKLDTLVTASGAADRVHFVGQVDNVADYLHTADLFVFTSRREGLPNVVLEAMASRLPVIMTPFIGLSDELGRAGEHYLLAYFQPDAIGNHMHMVLSQPVLKRIFGLAARQWVEANMDVDATLDHFAALYREFVMRTRTKA
jgi:glycosyltransferase involved in cell wall biosynthesis